MKIPSIIVATAHIVFLLSIGVWNVGKIPDCSQEPYGLMLVFSAAIITIPLVVYGYFIGKD